MTHSSSRRGFRDAQLTLALGRVRRGELGHGLGALRHSVLRQLPGEHQAHRRLHFARGEGRLLVVPGQLSGLASHALEHVVDERVHDGHSALGDTGVGEKQLSIYGMFTFTVMASEHTKIKATF